MPVDAAGQDPVRGAVGKGTIGERVQDDGHPDGLEALRFSGCEVGVCLHADGQYPPERLLPLALEFSVGEEAIPTRYADEVSHLNPVGYGMRVLRVVGKYLRGDFHRICEGPHHAEYV